MRTAVRKLQSLLCLAAVMSLSLPLSAQTQSLLLDQKMVGFVDNGAFDSVLFLSETGVAEWVKNFTVIRKAAYKITDPQCVPRSQSTMMMGASGRGMTLAYPFLVGVERVCYIDEQSGTIRMLANLRSQVRADSFSAVFAGVDNSAAYFLINGREFPDGENGYVLLVTIDKASLQVQVRRLMNDLPGLSGAMVRTRDSIWVTAWDATNDIYKLSSVQVVSAIRRGPSASFLQLAKKVAGGIEGLSLFMLANDSSFLYQNDDYGNYVVDFTSGSARTVTPPCLAVAGAQDGWLVLCDGTHLKKWTP